MWNPLPMVSKMTIAAGLWQAGARILEALGAEEQALRWIDRAVRLEPGRPALHLAATRLCLKRGRLDRAVLHWKKAAGEQGKTSLLYWLNRTNRQAFHASRLIQKNGIYGLEITPPPVEHNAGSKRGLKGKFSDLVQPGNGSPPLDEIGVQLLEMGRPEQALALFKQVQICRGSTPELFFNMGLAASKMGRHKEALEYYERAQAGGLNTVEVMNNKGFSLYHLERFEEAITCYELAREMCPGDVSILTNLGSCYQQIRMYARAISCYENALRCSTTDATTYNNYALCLDELGRHEEALQLYEQALALETGNPTCLLNKAACLQKLKRHQEAALLCQELLSRQPECVEAWGLLGNLFNEMGRIAEAVNCYRRGLGLI